MDEKSGKSRKRVEKYSMKVLSIIGARPQFVKEAIVQQELKKANIEEVLVHTGQHYDENMSGIFFEVLEMSEPNINLGIHGKTHGAMTGAMLMELEKIMIQEKPDGVILYGDTDSTLAGALAAVKLKLPVAHIEAGLRQEPKDMPEEINRVLTDRISTWLFAPSKRGMENLEFEHLSENAVFTGDVMYDIFLQMEPSFNDRYIKELNLTPEEYIVMTLHRDFNVDHREVLEEILNNVQKISKDYPVVLPLHPRTKKRIEEFDLHSYLDGLHLLEPIDYLELMGLTKECKYVITDSGGFQKESYFSGKRAIVLMPDTSWKELVEERINLLSSPEKLLDRSMEILEPINFRQDIYGNGDAAKKIVDYLKKHLPSEK
ncbi:MAG: UDP-N-acetylglucosamine 2-epimerase (non-hydrolyzing) [Tissierellia bacterium]|nr:UDP-N-acetylglucosamine 2-epimerase (non-hydrolyzing) [Tissierellia bacterium]